jgi:2-polyprenyl-3-methyl-5-hydroxy-6-metoxy-1,4-benzoquinol methylase
MANNAVDRQSTVRDDTAERHQKKYTNTGLAHRIMLGRFLDTLASQLRGYEEKQVLDFGCGEAYFWQEMAARGVHMQNLTGLDIREDALAIAMANHPGHHFVHADLFNWKEEKKFDLVIASQVLEHIPNPDTIVQRLLNFTKLNGRLLLTVPWEPFFRLGNLARGRDLSRFGNHPEHINLWSKREFRKFVEREAELISASSVFPFLITWAKQKKDA